MSTRVEKRILVNVPVSGAYNQWTQFEDFPHFMGGVQRVEQLSDERLNGWRRSWGAPAMAGPHPEADTGPESRLGGDGGSTNAGVSDVRGPRRRPDVGTIVPQYEPEGIVEKVGDKLNVVERQVENRDLKRFKQFIEAEGYATGAWRGFCQRRCPGWHPRRRRCGRITRGQLGKAGLSGKVIAGAGLAAAAGVAAVAGRKDHADEPETEAAEARLPTPLPPTGTAGSVFPGEGLPQGSNTTADENDGRS